MKKLVFDCIFCWLKKCITNWLVLGLLCTTSRSLFVTAKLQETVELDLWPSRHQPASLTIRLWTYTVFSAALHSLGGCLDNTHPCLNYHCSVVKHTNFPIFCFDVGSLNLFNLNMYIYIHISFSTEKKYTFRMNILLKFWICRSKSLENYTETSKHFLDQVWYRQNEAKQSHRRTEMNL